jgi:RNA polymerase sigma-70 factor, ECF subfamily
MSEFRQSIEALIPRLRRYARALTRNRDKADDLVQDTILRALAKEHLWQPGTDLRAWLFTLMHNQNVNVVRRGVREGVAVAVDDLSTALVAVADPTAGRQLIELDRALAQLSEDQRRVILLIGLEGVPYEEAAGILGIPVGTVRSRLSRGRENLRRLMDLPEPAARAVAASLREAA